jgi:predicted amidohydrolase
MPGNDRFKLAAIQASQVLFDLDGATAKACRLIGEAGAAGATIAAFGECWLSGYPFFVDATFRPLSWQAMAEYNASAVEVPSPTTARLCDAARKAGIDVVIGIVERDTRTLGTLYSTLLFIGREGAILGRHRKLRPTHVERAAWGDGDAAGLNAYQRPYGRISGLNCWEHNMILPTYALAAQGTQIHVAAWPGREVDPAPAHPDVVWPRQLLLSRAFASQAACYVIAAAGIRLTEHVPDRYKELVTYEHTGDSTIIDPRGEVIAGPAKGETILIAEGSMEAVLAAKSGADTGGHYSRPDLFRLTINRAVPQGLRFEGGEVGDGVPAGPWPDLRPEQRESPEPPSNT